SELLDGEVELSVIRQGKILITFTINHYSTKLDYDYNRNTLALRSNALLNANNVKPVLMSLADPLKKPHPLVARQSEGIKTGEYELPANIDRGGPWLVVPDSTSDVVFRAQYVAGCSNLLNDGEVKTLQKAAQLYDPQSNPDVIANVLKQMSADFSHSGWNYLKNIYKNFGYLPLSTFEVWRHLVRDERALVVALFVFGNDAKFISRLESELPIFWELIAIKHWKHAADLMKEFLYHSEIPENFIKPIIKTTIEKLGQAIPALSDTVVNWLVSGSLPQCVPAELGQLMKDAWYQDLLRMHSEDEQWPTEYAEELKLWCSNIERLPFEIRVNMSYQTGVVYLPLFTAAVTLDFVPIHVLKQLPKDAIFHLRKLRDFDRNWFEPMYRYFIAYFANQLDKRI
ncbi:MAG: STY4851/ECs_5259 family protein, partial [Enterovibrio sp.]